jgi:uncharacterized RDD family membrane protein YckC
MHPVHDLGSGVYYARRDYAGFWRRMASIVIDLLAIGIAGFLIMFVWDLAGAPGNDVTPSLVWLGFAYLYLILLRGSCFRTLGYILAGVRIVNLRGNRPSFLWMNLRLVLWCIGPLNPIVDLIWFGGDENRQMLRDKLTGTYVIRKNAVPIGEGPIRAVTLFILGYTIVYPEVTKTVPEA